MYSSWSMTAWLLDQRPEAGQEFVVRVLEAQLNPDKGEPYIRVYIRPSDRDGETVDYYICGEYTEMVQPAGA